MEDLQKAEELACRTLPALNEILTMIGKKSADKLLMRSRSCCATVASGRVSESPNS